MLQINDSLLRKKLIYIENSSQSFEKYYIITLYYKLLCYNIIIALQSDVNTYCSITAVDNLYNRYV